MNKTTLTKTILLGSTNPSVIKETRESLRNERAVNLVEKNINSRNLFQTIAGTQPDLILLDFESQEQPYFLAYKIASQYPMHPIVALLSEEKMEKADRAIQSGVEEIVQFPSPNGHLIAAIKKAIGPLEQQQMDKPEIQFSEANNNQGNTFAVFSPKGGAGVTTLAVNLAIKLHQDLKEEVLLIDGKHLFGHVSLYLNLLTGNSITDLIAHAGMLDQQLINQVIVKHKSGIHVLPSPTSINEIEGIKPENLFKVIQSLKKAFPNIIIDAGNTLDENSVTYLDSADKILLVLNPDLASMRDARQFMEIAETLSYSKEKILFLLNLTGRKEDVKREEIENILDMQIFGKVPSDEDTALNSLNEGIPVVMQKPKHAISKAIGEISQELIRVKQTMKTEEHEELFS